MSSTCGNKRKREFFLLLFRVPRMRKNERVEQLKCLHGKSVACANSNHQYLFVCSHLKKRMTKSLESSWGRVSRRKSSLCHSLTIDLRNQESRVDFEGCLKSSGENGEFEVYGERLPEPILGKNFRLPPRGRSHLKPLMDTSLSYVSIHFF